MTTITLPVSVVRALLDLAAVVDDQTDTERHAVAAADYAVQSAAHAKHVEDTTS
ncbi:MAG: hypothetical protein KDB37_20380 [Ilumatobacter sp.]|nr:hypothetical protein [Ilumatobacter sp.]